MRLVVIESPYAGDTQLTIDRHIAYAKRAMMHCLSLGEAPLASHLLYTQPGILLDAMPKERALGIQAGLEWAKRADGVLFYIDYGWSPGMTSAQNLFLDLGFMIETRLIGKNP